VNCEEDMREKKMRWVRGEMYVCGGGEEKRKEGEYMGGGEKKKEIKKKKEMREWGLRVWWEKKGSGKERRKKI
jgi:hypothetical protein